MSIKDSGSKREKNIWIVKPGENSNRGVGIFVTKSFEEIESFISNKKEQRTTILQKYIERPLLINKRKFDIRMFALATSINNSVKGYFYKDGYLRTSCREFSTVKLDRMIHLTNDAVQKNDKDYGKFENSNKLSYQDF